MIQVNPDRMKGGAIALALAELRPDIPFELLECWPNNRLLTEYRRRARAAANVTWRRPVSDMRDVYRSARLMLVPSQVEEAWGRVVTEAQISGIPVLASDIGGLPEAVGPGGILIAPDAPIAAWAAALASIWDDEQNYQRLVAAATEYSNRQEIAPGRTVADFLQALTRQVRALDNPDGSDEREPS